MTRRRGYWRRYPPRKDGSRRPGFFFVKDSRGVQEKFGVEPSTVRVVSGESDHEGEGAE